MTEITQPTPSRRMLFEAVIASTIGTTIEWYDFFLYGTAAALIFPKLYFPSDNEFLSQISAFGTFTVGFLARPFGGVIFGYMGDRIGRMSMSSQTMRSILDSIAMRLDEARDISRYMTGLLI